MLLELVDTGTEIEVGAVVGDEVASAGLFIVSCEGNVTDGTGVSAGAVLGASEVAGNKPGSSPSSNETGPYKSLIGPPNLYGTSFGSGVGFCN